MKAATAVVIGAGLGGIAAAARLARNGYEVTVLEKNAQPGGRCGQLVWQGHRFDTGPTLFLMPDVFKETYAALGEDMSDWLTLHKVDPTYTIRFSDGTDLKLTADLLEMRQQLESMEAGSFGGYLNYLDEGRRHMQHSVESFIGRNFYNLGEYFSPGNLPLLFKLKALVKHYDNIGRYFKDPHLKAAFTFQNMYLGLSPYDAPATYSLLQYTELAEGVWFPTGGMYEVVASLVRIAERLGVTFCYGTPVEKIEVNGSRATGVRLNDGRLIQADIVLANADLPYVYRSLLPQDKESPKLEKKKYTCSTFTFYWALDKEFPQLQTHNVFLSTAYRASFERIFDQHTLPDEPSFYIHAPSRIDPLAAPAGGDSLMALVPVGRLLDDGQQDWDEMHQRARQTIFERLEPITGPDLKNHIVFEETYTPKDWQNLYNLEKGAAFGLSHNFMQVGYLRPQNRHARYRNLYFTGASTHPGTGLPIVLLSARLAVERILKENGQLERV
jgi:phytoene desaturase